MKISGNVRKEALELWGRRIDYLVLAVVCESLLYMRTAIDGKITVVKQHRKENLTP